MVKWYREQQSDDKSIVSENIRSLQRDLAVHHIEELLELHQDIGYESARRIIRSLNPEQKADLTMLLNSVDSELES